MDKKTTTPTVEAFNEEVQHEYHDALVYTWVSSIVFAVLTAIAIWSWLLQESDAMIILCCVTSLVMNTLLCKLTVSMLKRNLY